MNIEKNKYDARINTGPLHEAACPWPEVSYGTALKKREKENKDSVDDIYSVYTIYSVGLNSTASEL
jgi:hypothetical protein